MNCTTVSTFSLRSACCSSSSPTVLFSHTTPAPASSSSQPNSIFLSHHSSSSLQLQAADTCDRPTAHRPTDSGARKKNSDFSTALSLRPSPRSYYRRNLLRLIVGDLTTPAGGGLLQGSCLSSRRLLSLLLFPSFYHHWTRLAWGGGPSGSGPASISASVGEQTLCDIPIASSR